MPRPTNPLKGWLAYYGELVGSWAKRNSRPCDAEDAAQDVICLLYTSPQHEHLG